MNVKAGCAALLLFMACAFQSAIAAASNSDQLLQASILSMLLADDPGAARLGARAIRILYPADERMTDFIAERLLQLTEKEPEHGWIRSTQGHITMLGQLKNARYRTVLKSVRERTTNADIQSRVDGALAEIGQAEAASYVPGSIDLSLERASATAYLKAARRNDRSQFANIKQDMKFDEVVLLIGTPDLISEWPVKGQKIVFHYQNLGVVLVTFKISSIVSKNHLEPPRLVVQFAAPESVPMSSIYNGNNYEAAQVIGCINGRAFYQYFHGNQRRFTQDMDAMNVLVQRIIKSSSTARRYDEKMFITALRHLHVSKDPRALEMLREVARMPGDDDTKKLAAKFVEAADKRIASGHPQQPVKPDSKASKQDEEDDDK